MIKTAITLSALLLAAASFAQAPAGGARAGGPGAAPGGAPGGAGAAGGMPTNEIIMERNDANKDGEITLAEATAAGTQLGQQFATFDLNSDGKVVASELDTMRGRIGGAGPGAGAPGAGGPRAGGPGAAAPGGAPATPPAPPAGQSAQ